MKNILQITNVLNIENLADILSKKDNLLKIALEKVKRLEEQILEVINVKFGVNIVGNEIKIDLNNKNVENIDLKLLTNVPFPNLKIIDLSNNKISNIESLPQLEAPNLNEINLHHNQISNINPLKDVKSKCFEIVDLRYNKIHDITVFKKMKEESPNKKLTLKTIKIDHNNILQEELENLSKLLSSGIPIRVYNKESNLEYDIKSSSGNEVSIRIFGSDFVKKNKNYCKLIVGGEEKEITEYYTFKPSKDQKTLGITLTIDDNIEDLSGMFFQCNDLKKVIEIFELNPSKITNIRDIFGECSSLESIPETIAEWDTSNITDISGLFYRCSSLKTIPDISRWNTSKVTNMMSIFNGCRSLQKIPDISKWDVKNVVNLSCMFIDCSSLKEIPKDISKWNTVNVTNIQKMFNGCTNIRDLSQLTNWNTSSVENMKNMFKNCTSLTKRPDISKWKMGKVKDKRDMFLNCPQ